MRIATLLIALLAVSFVALLFQTAIVQMTRKGAAAGFRSNKGLSSSNRFQWEKFTRTYYYNHIASTFEAENAGAVDLKSASPWWLRTLFKYILERNIHKEKDYTLHSPWLEGCVLEKAGSRSFKHLFCHLNDRQKGEDKCQGGTRLVQPLKSARILQKRYKFLVARDPLSRLLSGYMNKCISKPQELHCRPLALTYSDIRPPKAFVDSKNGKIPDSTMKKFRAAQLRPRFAENGVDAARDEFSKWLSVMPLHWDPHFVPISYRCNFGYRLASGDHFDHMFIVNSTLREQLDSNLPPPPKAVLVHDQGARERFSVGLDEAFGPPGKRPLKEQFHIHNFHAHEKTLDYFTPEAVATALKYYAADYVLLGLPFPSWLDKVPFGEY